MRTPQHSPLAALPGPRWRAALSPHTHICGPGCHLPWPPPRSGACRPAPWGDPTPRWPTAAACVYRCRWAGLGMFPGLPSPPPRPHHVFGAGMGGGPSPQSPRQPRAWRGPGRAGRRVGSRPPLLCLVPLIPIPWQWVLGTLACPICLFLPSLPSTPRDPGHSKGRMHGCDHPWLQSVPWEGGHPNPPSFEGPT